MIEKDRERGREKCHCTNNKHILDLKSSYG